MQKVATTTIFVELSWKQIAVRGEMVGNEVESLQQPGKKFLFFSLTVTR
jgi:hypothetical protein